jgi:hypothetical protein
MVGHGTKFSRKNEAIAALLTQRNIEEAARSIGISPNTLLRCMKEAEFQTAYPSRSAQKAQSPGLGKVSQREKKDLANPDSRYGVQVPFSTQVLVCVFPSASMYTFCSPVKVPVKVSATFSVRLLPEVLKEEPVPSNVHWLFDTDVEEPGTTAVDNQAVPASL